MSSVGDADHQRDAGCGRFHHGVGREGGGHEDHRGVGARLGHGLGDGVEHRQPFVRCAALAGRHAAHHVGAIGDRLLRVKRALAAGQALDQQASVLINEDAHDSVFLRAPQARVLSRERIP